MLLAPRARMGPGRWATSFRCADVVDVRCGADQHCPAAEQQGPTGRRTDPQWRGTSRISYVNRQTVQEAAHDKAGRRVPCGTCTNVHECAAREGAHGVHKLDIGRLAPLRCASRSPEKDESGTKSPERSETHP